MNNGRERLGAEPNVNTSEPPCEQEQYPSRLCIILTEKCNIQCRHCIYDCSPYRNEELDISTVETVIDQAAASGLIRIVGFSGGEPFMDMPRLERVISLCKEYGLESTVTTNGFWASSLRAALNVIKRLDRLTSLGISTDMFHQEFIPAQNIINAVTACNERGIDCIILVTHLNDPVHEVQKVREQLRIVQGLCEIRQWPVLRTGRALSDLDQASFFDCDPRDTVCISVDTPTLNVNGLLTACCGPSGHWVPGHRLSLANMRWQTLKPVLQALDQDPIIQAIRVWGPFELLKLAQLQSRKEGYPLSTPEASNICSICEYLFTNVDRTRLVEHALEHGQTRRKLAFARMAQSGEVSTFLSLMNCNDTSCT